LIFEAPGNTLDENANEQTLEGIPCGSKNLSGFSPFFTSNGPDKNQAAIAP
jgi:hypothetical protein